MPASVRSWMIISVFLRQLIASPFWLNRMSMSSRERPFVSGMKAKLKQIPNRTEKPKRKNVPYVMFAIMYGVEYTMVN